MNLLMLTKFYPYGTGEAFIENEVQVLSEYYENILIIACEANNSDSAKRPLPSNVKACKVPCGSKKKDVVDGAFMLLKKNTDLVNEKKNAKGLVRKLFLGYFEAKSTRVYKHIIHHEFISEFCSKPFVLYSYWFFMTARVATLIQNNYKPVYMFSRAHRYDLYEDKNITNYLPYRPLFLQIFDNVFPCSDNGTEYLKNKYGDKAANVRTSFLGTLDHGIGKPSTDGVFRIVSCSRTEPLKRVHRIIEALALLETEEISIEWTHVGDGSEFGNLKKLAEEKLHKIKFNFLGSMKNSDVMCLYRDNPYDLFVNVSDSEGLPVSIMEGISFGIPAIGTDVGGTSEIVIDNKTGKLIDSDFSNEELATAILDFAIRKNSNVSREMCRSFWEQHFQAIPNYRELYQYIRNQYENIGL